MAAWLQHVEAVARWSAWRRFKGGGRLQVCHSPCFLLVCCLLLLFVSKRPDLVVAVLDHQICSRGRLERVWACAEDRINSPIISLIPDLPIMLEDVPSLAQKSSHTGIDFLCRGHSRIKDADWVLANTFEELEPKSIEHIKKEIRNFLPVAPLQSYAKGIGLTVEDRSCLEWLDTQAPGSLLYVAFESISVVSKTELINIAKGVAFSKKPFLWVQRPTLSGDQDVVDLIFQILDGCQGMVVNWAPQVEVLIHPSIGGFFTHCGCNSTLESISAGVPMLGWPCMSEQPLNLRFLTQVWKIALDFKDASRDENGSRSAEGIKTCVVRLMDGSEGKACRMRIREVKELALQATRWAAVSVRFKELATSNCGLLAVGNMIRLNVVFSTSIVLGICTYAIDICK